ncbi:MAG: alpha/beta-type small acid-soluble spore protein [Clostridiales bacterium]|nr:alpha/beta-type small acid-soluble spore protein [Clostridiales bacterium]
MYQNQQNGNTNSSSNNSSNNVVVPEAKQALNNMKFEIANELGINLKQGYNGDMPSRQAGYIGGYMVNLMQPAERLCAFFELPPIRFLRPKRRKRHEATIEYRVTAGIDV